jgi:hypothetical protein
MAFKCALKALKTYVYYRSLEEENHVCSMKMLTSRKLIGDEILYSVSMLFHLNEITNICTANREQSDHYRRFVAVSAPTEHAGTGMFVHILGDFCIYRRA